MIPVGESRASKRGWSFDLKARKEARLAKSRPPVVDLEPQPSAVRKTPSKSKPPVVDLDTPPKVGKNSEKSKATSKQPIAEAKKKEFVYKSPERPNFIPEIRSPRALPFRINDPGIWRLTFETFHQGRERIEVNAAHMLLTTGKLFMEEVFANGFVTLFVDKNNPDTLTMCSPCGQVQIFKAFDHGLLFPTEIQTLLFRSPDIKKLALFKTDIDTFIVANRVPRIDLVEVHPIIKKNLVEIGSGVLNFLKTDLGETCEFEEADLNKDEHV